MAIGVATAVLAICASALFSATSARNTACINGNAKVSRLYCDGVDMTAELLNREDPFKCDCIDMPICKTIGIKVKGVDNAQQSKSGFQFCQNSAPAAYKGWVCTSAPQLTAKNWMDSDFNRFKWLPAVRPEAKCRHCHNMKNLACHSKCIWNRKTADKAVNCVLEQCADMCGGCQNTGPGNCDVGMCIYGSTPDPVTSQPVCNHKCRVEWRAWNGTSGKGYIRVIDLHSNAAQTLDANDAGFYFAVLDLNDCGFLFTNYSAWTDYASYQAIFGTQSGQLLADLITTTTGPYVNTYALGMTVGAATISYFGNPGAAPSPGYGAWVLGQNGAQFTNIFDPTYTQLGAPVLNACAASAEFEGILNANPTVSNPLQYPCPS